MATKRASHPSSGRRSGVLLLAAALALAGFALAARPPGGGGGGGGGGKTKTPAISVSPSSLAFGDVTVNTTSAAQSVTVTNSGRANLLITSITRSGSTAFAFTENCPDTLAVGASCAISVTFAPTATGAAAGSIAIVSNASNTPNVTVALSGSGTAAPSVAVRRGKGAGDSIMRGYNANCTSNTGLFDFICYGAGDKPQYSFFDGSSSSVTSIVARYVQLDPLFGGDQNAAASGSEMTDPTKNNFATQAAAIVGSASQPARVFVELGGNDLCNRATIGDLYSDATWDTAVRAGLNTLVNGLPDGSTVLMVSVPRVQDLRDVGIEKEGPSGGSVNCQNFWASFDVCRIATANGTDVAQRIAAVGERQAAYNARLVTLVSEYNSAASTTGVEVVTDYDPTPDASIGSYAFQTTDINGGDCFHPSIQGQNRLSEVIWNRNPYK